MKKLRLLLILCASVFSVQTYAMSCYESSPAYLSKGDAYFELDSTVKLSAVDEKRVKSFLSRIKGKWEGALTEVNCTGPDRSPVRTVTELKTEASFTSSGGNYLNIKLNKKNTDSGISKQETLYLLPEDALFSLVLEDNELSATQKLRRSTVNGGSRLIEISTSIRIKKDSIDMLLEHFSNGVFIYSQHFILTEK